MVTYDKDLVFNITTKGTSFDLFDIRDNNLYIGASGPLDLEQITRLCAIAESLGLNGLFISISNRTFLIKKSVVSDFLDSKNLSEFVNRWEIF